MEVLTQGACCGGVKAGCVLWREGANTKECTGCVCVCVCVCVFVCVCGERGGGGVVCVPSGVCTRNI